MTILPDFPALTQRISRLVQRVQQHPARLSSKPLTSHRIKTAASSPALSGSINAFRQPGRRTPVFSDQQRCELLQKTMEIRSEMARVLDTALPLQLTPWVAQSFIKGDSPAQLHRAASGSFCIQSAAQLHAKIDARAFGLYIDETSMSLNGIPLQLMSRRDLYITLELCRAAVHALERHRRA